MAVKKVIAIVEASSTGFGVYAEGEDLLGITGYGSTVERAKKDFLSALEEVKESYGRKVPKELRVNLSLSTSMTSQAFSSILAAWMHPVLQRKLV